MDLGCPLLRVSSVRRLRRRAAILPLFLERTFPFPVFVSSCAEVMTAMKGLVGENKFSWARHLNKTCCHRSSCQTSPSCQKCLDSVEASISATIPKGPVTAGCNCRYCHVLYDLPPPLLPGCWIDWAAGWGRSGGSCHPNPYGVVGSLESSLRVTTCGSEDEIEDTGGIPVV